MPCRHVRSSPLRTACQLALLKSRPRRRADARHGAGQWRAVLGAACRPAFRASAWQGQPGRLSRTSTSTPCRAVAAAVFGDAAKVRFVPLTAVQRFTGPAVGRGRRAGAQRHLDLSAQRPARPHLHRRQLLRRHGLPGRQSSPARQARDLNGGTICAQPGTDTPGRRAGLLFAQRIEVLAGHLRARRHHEVRPSCGRCDAMTSDLDSVDGHPLDVGRCGRPRSPLPEIVTKEPLSPAVRGGDDQWANIVRWSFWAQGHRRGARLDRRQRRCGHRPAPIPA